MTHCKYYFDHLDDTPERDCCSCWNPKMPVQLKSGGVCECDCHPERGSGEWQCHPRLKQS